MLRTGIVPSPSKSRVRRVLATDGRGDPLKGVCVFFIRPNNTKPVTQANIAEELLCGCLDASNGRSVLQVWEEYLSKVMLPALQSSQNWGSLKPAQVEGFMTTLRTYISFLHSQCCRLHTHTHAHTHTHTYTCTHTYTHTFACMHTYRLPAEYR